MRQKGLKGIFPVVVILGPTASGKTSLAVKCAGEFSGEIISADSRQIYKGLDIGTGKDLKEFNGIKYHLIDIVSPGDSFNLKMFQILAYRAISEVHERSRLPIVCGGTPLYIDSIISRYDIPKVRPDVGLRRLLEKSDSMLFEEALKAGIVDAKDHEKRKLIRRIEVSKGEKGDLPESVHPDAQYLLIGVKPPREIQKKLITQRLEKRIKQGLIDEVVSLQRSGVDENWLSSLGLEYRWGVAYIKGKVNYDTFFKGLRSDIIAFSKRQNSWFKKIENKGFVINWFGQDEDRKVMKLIKDFL
ncbi:tRNA (adenosine(37)-N6)-dimethylallyltransferase MiaA [candidate division WOR-3 bacterium]|nr:tRNA (adenosine(37)-N6)-dimethylallyltransferase MiaA [candidate division WOR-3 bacterium]